MTVKEVYSEVGGNFCHGEGADVVCGAHVAGDKQDRAVGGDGRADCCRRASVDAVHSSVAECASVASEADGLGIAHGHAVAEMHRVAATVVAQGSHNIVYTAGVGGGQYLGTGFLIVGIAIYAVGNRA